MQQFLGAPRNVMLHGEVMMGAINRFQIPICVIRAVLKCIFMIKFKFMSAVVK